MVRVHQYSTNVNAQLHHSTPVFNQPTINSSLNTPAAAGMDQVHTNEDAPQVTTNATNERSKECESNCGQLRVECWLDSDCWSWIYQLLTRNEAIQLSRTTHKLQAIAERRASHRPFPTFPTVNDAGVDEMEFDIIEYHTWNRSRETVIMTPLEFIHASRSRVMQHISDLELILPCDSYYRQSRFQFPVFTERDLIEAIGRYKSIRALRLMISLDVDEVYSRDDDGHSDVELSQTLSDPPSCPITTVGLVNQLMRSTSVRGLVSFELCNGLVATSFDEKIQQCIMDRLSELTNILHVSLDIHGEHGLNSWLPYLRQIQFASNRGVFVFTGPLDGRWNGSHYVNFVSHLLVNPSLDIFPTCDGYYIDREYAEHMEPDQQFVRGGRLSANSIPPTHILLNPTDSVNIFISPTWTRHLSQTRLCAFVHPSSKKIPFQSHLAQLLHLPPDDAAPPLQSLLFDLDGSSLSPATIHAALQPLWQRIHSYLRELRFKQRYPMSSSGLVISDYFKTMVEPIGRPPLPLHMNQSPSITSPSTSASVSSSVVSSSSSSSGTSGSGSGDEDCFSFPRLERLTLHTWCSSLERPYYTNVFTDELCLKLKAACPSLSRLHLNGFIPPLGSPFLTIFPHLIELGLAYHLPRTVVSGEEKHSFIEKKDPESFAEMLTRTLLHLRQLEYLLIFLTNDCFDVTTTIKSLSHDILPILHPSTSLHELTFVHADHHKFFLSKRHLLIHQRIHYRTFLQLHVLWSILQPSHQLPYQPSTRADRFADISCLISPLLSRHDRHRYQALVAQLRSASISDLQQPQYQPILMATSATASAVAPTSLWLRLKTSIWSMVTKLTHRLTSTLSRRSLTDTPTAAVARPLPSDSREVHAHEFREAVKQFLLRHPIPLLEAWRHPIKRPDSFDGERPSLDMIQPRHFNLRFRTMESYWNQEV